MACMGVIFFLVYVCVRKHKSNLPTNIRTTVGKKTQWYVEKCNLLSETTFLPYYITVWCVFFYQSVYFFTNCFYHVSSEQYTCTALKSTVLKSGYKIVKFLSARFSCDLEKATLCQSDLRSLHVAPRAQPGWMYFGQGGWKHCTYFSLRYRSVIEVL